MKLMAIQERRAANNASVIPSGICSSTFSSSGDAELRPGGYRGKNVDPSSHNPYWKKLHEHIDARTVDTGAMTTIRSSRR